ncbi:MAG: hypothetical protein V7K68_21865 [Nostoc sp.]|uniref:hypothetical protein n=1 Tax=Nostoc sp. TaxID=1180 RepID=UPI002FFAEF52
MSTSEPMDAVFLCNYDGAMALKNNADSQAVLIANDEVSPTVLAAPPKTWKEHWLDHEQLLSLVHHNEHVAVYYDKDVSRSVTWPFTYMPEVWQYTKKVYGKFGTDSRLYAIYHTNKYSGGHPSTYLDASHDHRNVIDVGSGPWKSGKGNDLDLCTHEVAHIVEDASKGKKGSPAFTIWGDSKWAEIFIYDVYRGLDRTMDAKRWHDLMMKTHDNFPRANTQWFKDWFHPIYSKHGGSATLNRFFHLLSDYFPKNNNTYIHNMNWGEFVHFWSGAADNNLKSLATEAFGWTDDMQAQFSKARTDFPKIKY